LPLADVDGFKALNDTCGHAFGDEYLHEPARLRAEIVDGSRARVSRSGGEEFVLLPGHDLDEAQRLGVNLCRRTEALSIGHPASIVANHITVSASRPP
jgi:diguanylate cyclase (GGDEF)-like protein